MRPRRNRIEVTLDFTPDPGLTVAAAALIVGIVREVMTWPSYRLEELDHLPVGVPAGLVPRRHTTRNGWLVKEADFPRNPFRTGLDARVWTTTRGDLMSLREMAMQTVWHFRRSILRHSDGFTLRLLLAVLSGASRSLLDLADRPSAYEDVGRSAKWGLVLPELEHYGGAVFREGHRRSLDASTATPPPWAGERVDRRSGAPPAEPGDRRRAERRRPARTPAVQRLPRSPYERLFARLASARPIAIGPDRWTPVAMKGWYEAVLRRESDGAERIISVDELLERME